MGRVMHACNISMHAIYSPKILHLNIVFNSPREDLISLRKNVRQWLSNLFGENKVYYGQCIIGE